MFYLLAIGSMLGYSLQESLLVRYARRIDGMSLAFYRNISFIVTLAPLLFFVPASGTLHALAYWPWWIFAGMTGGLSLAIRFAAYGSIPIGVVTSIGKASDILFTTTLSWLILREALSFHEVAVIGLIIVGALWLGFVRNHMAHLTNKMLHGASLAIIGTFFKSVSGFTFLWISRQTDPLASSYLWETIIGVSMLVVLVIRELIGGRPIARISLKTFLLIAACSAPTLIGTAGLALAVNAGPIGIASAIGSASLVVTSLLMWRWHNEKLKAAQWSAILIIATGVALLKFV